MKFNLHISLLWSWLFGPAHGFLPLKSMPVHSLHIEYVLKIFEDTFLQKGHVISAESARQSHSTSAFRSLCSSSTTKRRKNSTRSGDVRQSRALSVQILWDYGHIWSPRFATHQRDSGWLYPKPGGPEWDPCHCPRIPNAFDIHCQWINIMWPSSNHPSYALLMQLKTQGWAQLGRHYRGAFPYLQETCFRQNTAW